MTYFPLQLLKNNLVHAKKQVSKFAPRKHKKGYHYPAAAEVYYAKQFKWWTSIKQQLESSITTLRATTWCVVELKDKKKSWLIRTYDYVLDEMSGPRKVIYIGDEKGAISFKNNKPS